MSDITITAFTSAQFKSLMALEQKKWIKLLGKQFRKSPLPWEMSLQALAISMAAYLIGRDGADDAIEVFEMIVQQTKQAKADGRNFDV